MEGKQKKLCCLLFETKVGSLLLFFHTIFCFFFQNKKQISKPQKIVFQFQNQYAHYRWDNF